MKKLVVALATLIALSAHAQTFAPTQALPGNGAYANAADLKKMAGCNTAGTNCVTPLPGVDTAASAAAATANTAAATANTAATQAETDAQTGISQVTALQAQVTSLKSNVATLKQQNATQNQTISGLKNSIAAMKAVTGNVTGMNVNPTTGVVTINGPGGIVGTFPPSSTSGGGGTTPTYSRPNDGLPNILLSVDPAEPASTATCTAGTVGCIQVDTSTPPNVLGVNDVVAGITATNGYGALSLRTDNTLNRPYFHGGSDSLNMAYDGVVYPPATGAPMIGPVGQASGCLMVAKQTADQATAFTSFWGNANVDWTGTSSPDGDTFIGEAGAIIAETSSALTALNQLEVMYWFSPDGQRLCIGRDKSVACSSASTLGGIYGLTRTELLNNPQADVYFGPECWTGYPGDTAMTAAINYWESDPTHGFGITGDTATFSTPSPSVKAPLAADATATFLTTVNNPTTNALPTIAGATPGSGIAMQSGWSEVADVLFGSSTPNANVPDGPTLRNYFYMNYIYGNLDTAIGCPMDTGQCNAPFAAVARHYDPSDPNDVHKVMSDGVYLSAICGQNHTSCTPGTVWSAMLRAPTFIRPGMLVKVRYKAPPGPNAWTPIWLGDGEQNTPGPGNSAYSTGTYAGAQIFYGYGTSGHKFEIDANDMFPRPDAGTPQGQQVISWTPDIYGVQWKTAPYRYFMANTSAFTDEKINEEFEQLNSINCAAVWCNLYMNWRNDGSNLIDFLIGTDTQAPQLITSIYMEYPASMNGLGGTQMAMNLMLGNQAIPGAALNGGVVPDYAAITENDGLTDGWTLKVQEIAIFNGNVANPTSYEPTQSAANTITPAALSDQSTYFGSNASAFPSNAIPSMPAGSPVLSASSGTPRIEQWRGGSLLVTYSSFSDQPGCNRAVDANGLYYTNAEAVDGKGTNLAESAASGCGPFTRTHYFRMWAPGDVFKVYPAVYANTSSIDTMEPYIGPAYDNGNAYNQTLTGTGSISGNTFTATAGSYFVGGTLSDASGNIMGRTIITASLGNNKFTINNSQNIASESVEEDNFTYPDNITVEGVVQNNTRPLLQLSTGAGSNTLGQGVIFLAGGSGDSITDINVMTQPGWSVGKGGVYMSNAANLTFARMRVSGFENGLNCIFSAAGSQSGYFDMDQMEIDHCGGQGDAHGAYLGASLSDPSYTLNLTHSYMHDATLGHLFKTRLQNGNIYGNFFQGGLPQSGQADAEVYDLDIPNGGTYDIECNIFTKTTSGPDANGISIAYDLENANDTSGDASRNYVSTIKNNTFVNGSATFDGTHLLVPIQYDYPAVIPNGTGWAALGWTATVLNNAFVGTAPSSYWGNSAVIAGLSEIGSNFALSGAGHVLSGAGNPACATYLHPAQIGPARTTSAVGARD